MLYLCSRIAALDGEKLGRFRLETARAVRLDASGRLTRRPGAFFFSTRLHLPPDPASSPSGPSFISLRTRLPILLDPASSPSEPSFISFWTQLPILLDPASYPTGTLQKNSRHTLSILKQAVWVCLPLANSLRSTCHLRAKYLPSPCESNKKMDSVPLLLSRKKCSIRYRGSVHLR